MPPAENAAEATATLTWTTVADAYWYRLYEVTADGSVQVAAVQQKTAQSPAALVQAQNRPPVSAAAPAYAVKTEKKRWPVPAWLFCLFAALAAAAGTYYAIVLNAMLFCRETFMSALFGRANYRAAIYLEVFLGVFPYLLAAVLFLIHTKRKSPWVTALPWTLLLLIFSVEKFGMIFMV